MASVNKYQEEDPGLCFVNDLLKVEQLKVVDGTAKAQDESVAEAFHRESRFDDTNA